MKDSRYRSLLHGKNVMRERDFARLTKHSMKDSVLLISLERGANY